MANLCNKDTVVVPAGDPLQLGPIKYSKEAEKYGLGKSSWRGFLIGSDLKTWMKTT